MLKKILIVLVVLILLVVVVGAVLPTEYKIEKSVDIQAGPAQVHALVGDLERWPEWTPWVEMDSTIVTTLGDRTTGVGAYQSWTGEGGDGELTFTRCDESSGIAYDMNFIMGETKTPSSAEMNYTANGGTTTVTWAMAGDVSDFMPPVVAGLMTPMMKSSIGAAFDQGLAKLKEKAESEPEPMPEPELLPEDGDETEETL